MCGRFSLGANREEIINQLVQDGILPQLDEQEWLDRDDFYPRYNIAPRSRAAVIRRRYGSPNEDAHNSIITDANDKNTHGEGSSKSPATTEPALDTIVQTMRWGLVPRYAKADLPSITANTINARVESILEGNRTWASVVNTHRCVVICDGYYEWLTKGKEKLPHFIRNPNSSKKLYMAGMWEEVAFEGSDRPLFTFTIVTVPARDNMTWLHDRMPLIFSPNSSTDMENLNMWLDTDKNKNRGPEIHHFLQGYLHHSGNETLTIYQVPKEVGKVGKESPSFIQPVQERKDGIRAMFAKQKQATSSEGTSAAEKPNTNENADAGTSQSSSETRSTAKRQRSVSPDNSSAHAEGSSRKKIKIDPSDPPTKAAEAIQGDSPAKRKPSASPRKKGGTGSPSKKDAAGTRSIVEFFQPSPRKTDRA
ncbi:DUF159-domain-containing protein [Serendipita vermifera]|nr:DUF159-domain-containing protein [Serendipita vermifera]